MPHDMQSVDRVFDDFEALLGKCGVAIAGKSRLEHTLLFARHAQNIAAGEAALDVEDDRPCWREVAGIFDLARRMIIAEDKYPKRFRYLLGHVGLFASAEGQLAQNAPADQRIVNGQRIPDQDADKLFELLVGLALLPSVGDLVLDKGKGDNPDLLFRYGDEQWAVACKRLYSLKPERYRDTIVKAISQIERSSACRGVVFVSLSNVVEHDVFLPKTSAGYIGMSKTRMCNTLKAEEQRLSLKLIGLTDHELAIEFAGKKADPGVVHYVGTTYFGGTPDDYTVLPIQHVFSRGIVGDFAELFQRGLNSTSTMPAQAHGRGRSGCLTARC
jgi:hypothetical protein